MFEFSDVLSLHAKFLIMSFHRWLLVYARVDYENDLRGGLESQGF